jgi:PAS domain S-box-containing protein
MLSSSEKWLNSACRFVLSHAPEVSMHASSEEWISEPIEVRLSEELERAHQARFLLAAVAECSEDAIISESLDGEIDNWNPGAERLYGYSLDEIRGRNHSLLTAPEDLPELRRVLEQVGKGLAVERQQMRQLRKDGAVVEVSLSLRPIRDSRSGIIGVVAVARDITDGKIAERLKASLREKELLLKEVHHRVKNNLQVISSLLNLQARHVVDPRALELFKESQNRVRSIALFHEKLYQAKDLGHVEAFEYLNTLIANLLAAYGAKPTAVSLEVEREDILLGVDVAIPLGLVLNELISNALKHAFPDGRRGQIRVQLGRCDKDRYRLVVSDNGVGFPADLDFRNAPSLGLQLVCTLVDQLAGTIELIGAPGTTFNVTFDAIG